MKLVVTNHLTLDGVMQAPAGPEEDTRDNFEYGGWSTPYADEVMGRAMSEGMDKGGAMLLGRRTYQHFASFWPNQPDDNPIAKVLNEREKYVASTTLEDPLPWENSTLLSIDVAARVAELKEQPGGDLVILGSGALIQSMIPHDLIDEYVLLIHPLILGSGRRLFPDGGALASLQLVDSTTTTTGVVIATYQPAG